MNKSTLTHEKVRELVNALQSNANLDCYDRRTYYEVVDEWLDAQTFVKPDVGNSDTSSNWDDAWIQELSTELAGFAYSKENIKSLITAFLDKKPDLSKVKVRYNPIVVGLSDEQVEELGGMIEKCYGKTWTGYAQSIIANYLKAQTFAQSDVGIRPNWDDSSAKYFQIRECWLDERGTVTSWKLNKQFERPKPTLQKVS